MFKSMLSALAVAALAFVAMPALSRADEPPALSPKQEAAVKKLIHDYLLENPHIVMEAVDALREKERVAAEMRAKKILNDRKDKIFNDPESPVLGNPKGDVTIVEFFDYRCQYCKAMLNTLFETVKTDGKVRLVMKELPILGPESVLASRAAIASRPQKKYGEFHLALMRYNGALTEPAIMRIASGVGISVERLKKDMEAPEIGKIIDDDIELAHDLDFSGTPGFIVGSQLVPGAMSGPALRQLIAEARKPKS